MKVLIGYLLLFQQRCQNMNIHWKEKNHLKKITVYSRTLMFVNHTVIILVDVIVYISYISSQYYYDMLFLYHHF